MTTTASRLPAASRAGPGRPPRGPSSVFLGALLIGLLVPTGLARGPAPDELPDSAAALVGAVSAALRADDAAGLIALVDFPAHSAEGRLRGTALQDWSRLDDAAREAYRQDLAQTWLGDDPGFLRFGRVYDFQPLEDPDAGHGPVPDRYLMKVVLKASARGQHRELILIGTPGHRLIQLVFGPAFVPGSNPLGPGGLQPRSFRKSLDASLRWPEDLYDYERDAARELVDELLASTPGFERERLIEFLHRSPHAGVAALLERLLRLPDQASPDGSAARLLVVVLERLTGRHGGLPDADQPLSPEQLRAEARSWLSWHGVHGATFAPTPVEEPIEPTFAERDLDDFPPRGWHGEDDEDATPPAAEPPPPTQPAQPETATASETAAPVGEPAGPELVEDGDTLVLEGSGGRDGPSVRFRKPPPVNAEPEPATGLTGFEVLLVPPGADRGEVLPVEQTLERLPAVIQERLDQWSGLLNDLGARVAFGGDEDLLVVGLGSDAQLIGALTVMQRARDELGPLMPRTPAGAGAPVIAVLADDELLRGDGWGLLLDGLVQRRLLDDDVAQGLRRDRGGATNRTAGWFLQPTMDLVGDAAAGDDEFRLDNELAHKVVGCLAVQRCGFLPRGLIWALGHLAEQRLFGTTYQFNKTGFVAVGDHFDWPRQARQALEKASRKRSFELGLAILGAGEPADELDGQLIAWAALEYLAARRPSDLTALFEDLAELHREARPYGGARDYEGAPEPTAAALALRLGQQPVDQILAHLERLD